MSLRLCDILLVVRRTVVVQGQVGVGVDVGMRVGKVDGLLGDVGWREVGGLEVRCRRRVT